MKNWIAMSLLVLAWLVPVVAMADPPRVYVLNFQSVEGDDDFARGISLAIRMALMDREGISLSDRSVTLEQMRLANDCSAVASQTDADCYARIADTLGADLLIAGVVRRSSSDQYDYDFLVSCEVYDARSASIVANREERFSRSEADAELMARIRQLVDELVSTLNAGTQATADTSETTQESTSEPTAETTPATPGISPLALTGGVMLGTAVVTMAFAIGGGVYVDGLNSDPVFAAYRLRVPSARNGIPLNVCTEARAGHSWAVGDTDASERAHVVGVCNDADAWEVAVPILWVGAGVLAAAGATLLGIGLTSDAGTSVTVTPSVGPDHAYLGLSGSF